MRKQLSILFVHDASSVCETLAKEAVAVGDDVRLVLPKKGLTTYPSLADHATVVSGGLAKTAETYASALFREDYDVVVANSRLSWVLGGLASKVRGVKMVTILMGSDIRRFWTLPAWKRLAFERGLRASDLVYYASPDTASLVQKLGVAGKLIRFPIDTAIFSSEGDAQHLDGDPAVFLPTRLDIDKGTRPISNLVSHVLARHPKAKIHLVRWPNTESAVKELAGSANSDKMKLVGFLKRREMARYYRGSSVLIGQMKLGFGSMTEMEAISCGLPAVFYDRYGGYGVPERADRQVADFFDSLMEDASFRKRKVEEGMKLISELFDSRKVYSSFRENLVRLSE